MTINLDLLTEEERVLWNFCVSRKDKGQGERGIIIPEEVIGILNALATARAENKALQEKNLELIKANNAIAEINMRYVDSLAEISHLNMYESKNWGKPREIADAALLQEKEIGK